MHYLLMLDYTLSSDANLSTVRAPDAPFIEYLLDVDVWTPVEVLGFAFVVTSVGTQALVASLFKELQDADVAHEVATNATHPGV